MTKSVFLKIRNKQVFFSEMIYCISEIRCILNVKVQNVGRIVPHNDLYNLFTKYIDGVRQNNVLTFQLLTPLFFANRDR